MNFFTYTIRAMNVLDQNIKRDGSEVILDFFLKEKKKEKPCRSFNELLCRKVVCRSAKEENSLKNRGIRGGINAQVRQPRGET